MNRIQLGGRLTRDPEIRYTQTGRPVASFTLAVSRPKPKDSSRPQEADFIDIVAWGVLAESCGNTLQKGQLVNVDGRLQTRSYEAQDGTKRKVTEVVASTVAQPLDAWERNDTPRQAGSGASSFGTEVLPDEDMPF